jgi:hypothetical protein
LLALGHGASRVIRTRQPQGVFKAR